MATPNKGLEQPARGSNVGVWDTPVNNNMGIIDNAFGGMATIALTNSPVILSSAQYQCMFINFTGALSGDCAITFPTVGSIYTIQNLTSNTSSFQVSLQTTAPGTQLIVCPGGEAFDIMTDPVGNVKFRDLGRVGSYWDYAGSSVPRWVTACSVPPYLLCDGSPFSSGAYPVLATILGGTTLPDSRGRYRASLNDGTARITSGSSTGGIDGNTKFASGGSQTTTLSSQNMPPIPITDPGHSHLTPNSSASVTGGTNFSFGYVQPTGTTRTSTDVTNITAGNASPTNFSNLPPTYIGGITMIRAA